MQEFTSGTELIQAFQEDDFARQFVASARGIKHSAFFDTVNDRGVEQLLSVFTEQIRKRQNCTLVSTMNHGVPRKLFLTEGNGAERPFVSNIIDPGQTGVLDRGYQAHYLFDQWQQDACHFVCRIKETTHHDILEEFPVPEDSHVFLMLRFCLELPMLIKPKSLSALLVILLRVNRTG